MNTAPSTGRFKMWFVRDWLSGETIDNRYYTTKDEAVARRNELGYGVVYSYEFLENGQYYEESETGRKVRVFPE